MPLSRDRPGVPDTELSMLSNFSPNQSIRKPVVRSDGGIVAAQHVGAAAVGAKILADGGNGSYQKNFA